MGHRQRSEQPLSIRSEAARQADMKPPRPMKGILGPLARGTGPMIDLRKRGSVRRWVADFALAFVLFWAAALGLGAAHSRAYAVALPVLVREVTADAGPASPASLRANELSGMVAHASHKPARSPEHAR